MEQHKVRISFGFVRYKNFKYETILEMSINIFFYPYICWCFILNIYCMFCLIPTNFIYLQLTYTFHLLILKKFEVTL